MKGADCELAVVGGGAAGMMAAIQAAGCAPGVDVLIIERRVRPGAKLLVSGGGRCNLANRRAGPSDFNTTSPRRAAHVVRAFPAEAAAQFFQSLGLSLAEEADGRLYPASHRASEVLDLLLATTRRLGIRWQTDTLVEELAPAAAGWTLATRRGLITARRVVLAPGGQSLPRSGSDGNGLDLARRLGLRAVEPLVPALSPLRLDPHPFPDLAGVACPAVLRLARPERRRQSWGGDVLITHFGLSGPATLDASRHVLREGAAGGDSRLLADWLPALSAEELRRRLESGPSRTAVEALAQLLPRRLAQALSARAGLAADHTLAHLTRHARTGLLEQVKASPLAVAGARSWHHAETTAGGVSLDEVDTATMEARSRPGLHLCGELCDVDGRLGGFNFQWAWSSGAVAGRGAARALRPQHPHDLAGEAGDGSPEGVGTPARGETPGAPACPVLPLRRFQPGAHRRPCRAGGAHPRPSPGQGPGPGA